MMNFRPVPPLDSRSLLLGCVGLLACGHPTLTLTGIVTTDEVLVGSQVAGQVSQLLVREGDSVKAGQVLAVLAPDELRAESLYYAHSAAGLAAQVQQATSVLRWQQLQTVDQITRAEANVASAAADRAAAAADLEMADLTFKRAERLAQQGLDTPQQLDQARTASSMAQAHLVGAAKRHESAQAALALAKADAEQNVIRQSQLEGSRQSLAAAQAQGAKAGVRLGYAELRAPVDGVVDVRVVRIGEVVKAGDPVLTLVDPDDLWVRADVEESYLDRVKLGDSLMVRLASGAERRGAVFFRGVDAAYATRRDVSRTKRDIKTFELRVRLDNRDRRLAVGMTAFVILPTG